MTRSRTRSLASAALVAVCAAAPLARAETIVLDSQRVVDWARVYTSYTWKQKDTCLHPNALLKFDLTPIHGAILDARLVLFVERVQNDPGVELWHVADDSWSYAATEPVDLWNWPVQDLIVAQSFSDTTSFSVDVTAHLLEEALAGSTEFSVKISGPSYPNIRIASPRAPLERMRPRIIVEYSGPATPPLPDVAASCADIHLTPMRVVPGQNATLSARIRNIGAADAWNIPVAFYEGDPNTGNPPIGIWIIGHLPGGGGEEEASVLWTAVRGAKDIHVVADFEGVIGESDETNNAAMRTFIITDADEYAESLESFEAPGRCLWHADFDVPKQFEYPGPKSFYINQAPGESYHGENAMELYLDGTADDGTIWVESAIPVERYSRIDVAVDYELFRYSPDMAFIPVVAVSLVDPEREGDFAYQEVESRSGWSLIEHRATLFTGPYDLVHVAVGLTCTWETPGTFFLDLIHTRVDQLPVSVLPADEGRPSDMLQQSRPNPSGSLATIVYELAQSGPISLSILDSTGRQVATLRAGVEEAGVHHVRWDGTDRLGRPLPAGVYFYKLLTGQGEESRKLMLMH